MRHVTVWLTCEGPLDRRGGSFKYRSLDRSQKVATWLIDSQGALAWNKGRPTGLFTHLSDVQSASPASSDPRGRALMNSALCALNMNMDIWGQLYVSKRKNFIDAQVMCK